jgi:hypothetical protein
MPRYHQDKEIDAFIKETLGMGWRLKSDKPAKGHVKWTLLCPHADRDGCTVKVVGTPANIGNTLRRLKARRGRCPHMPP